MQETKKKPTGYDKYVDWKLFFIPVVLLVLILVLPTPYGMKDVGMEYNVGPKAVINFITTELFNAKSSEAEQWQIATAQVMERNMRMGALSKERFLKQNLKWCKKNKIQVDASNFKKTQNYIRENVSDEEFIALMNRAR